MKPLSALTDPKLMPRAGGFGAMAFGLLSFTAAVVIITIAAVSARNQDEKMVRLERELDALSESTENLRQALADSIEQDKALADAIATVAVESRR